MENAKFIVESGLSKAGYEYYCLDGESWTIYLGVDERLLDGE